MLPATGLPVFLRVPESACETPTPTSSPLGHAEDLLEKMMQNHNNNNNNNSNNNNYNINTSARLQAQILRYWPPAGTQDQQTIVSDHLRELQREIKDEEDEIFADINSLINRSYSIPNQTASVPPVQSPHLNQSHHLLQHHHPHHHHHHHHQQQQQQQQQQLQHQNLHLHLQQQQQNHYRNKYNQRIGHNSHLTEEEDEEEDEDEEEEYEERGEIEDELAKYIIDHHHTPTPGLTEGLASQDYQDMQDVIQRITNSQPKPCVFFLEGNCRRSDCKYSHDLSNITCKYWMEGFCFKGEMCPFMHSYTPQIDAEDPSLDDDGLKKKDLNPTFAIESEADFPSLPLDSSCDRPSFLRTARV